MTRSTITTNKNHRPVLITVLLILSFLRVFSAVDASLVINEIAYKGSGETICDKEDWIELFNSNEEDFVDLTNYVLHDDNVEDDDDAMTFTGVIMAPGEFLVLCKENDFRFGIGNDDTVTLLDASGTITSSVTLPGTGTDEETYAFFDGEYKYTATPTPDEANIYTERLSVEEQLEAQNKAGDDFFLVNDAQVFSRVVDLFVVVDEDSMAIIDDHPAWEEYVPFFDLSVSNIGDTTTDNDEDPIVTASSGGKIRTKGQWTKSMTTCLGFKNIPFQIKFNTPFMGMETMYLRNLQDDISFMRDHASHTILEAVSLPYLRTRPARLFLNGDYVGFYTLMEAPTQGYVMQRSFGAFESETSALFKAKTSMRDCPFTILPEVNATSDLPDPFYFERGDHREDIPVLGFEGYGQCVDFHVQERDKDHADEMRGYLEYDQNCGVAMVKMGIVDRDFGPKSMEDPMIDFLENKFYNESVYDLTDSIDTDQWLRNIAVYAIMINVDSPMGVINNWYLASTNGGVDDWKIVQYDHQGVTTKSMANFGCRAPCGPRLVYWPILRPTCGAVEDHMIVGRILNSQENVEKYLEYVQEYVDILTNGGVLEKLYDYGNDIKEFAVDDPWFHYPTIEAYEESELGADIQDYNTDESPFLKTLQVRLQEIQKQLDAIKEGSLPRNGIYDSGSVCPDWRDSGFEDYAAGSTVEDNEIIYHNSDSLVESESCGAERSSGCASAAECFDHKSGICAFDGEILTVECREFLPSCEVCFPYSRCGSAGGASDDLVSDAANNAHGSWTTTMSLVLALAFTWYQAAA